MSAHANASFHAVGEDFEVWGADGAECMALVASLLESQRDCADGWGCPGAKWYMPPESGGQRCEGKTLSAKQSQAQRSAYEACWVQHEALYEVPSRLSRRELREREWKGLPNCTRKRFHLPKKGL